jgi:hypothetical protein
MAWQWIDPSNGGVTMFLKCLGSFIALVFLCIAGTASAATLKITATSAGAG